MGKSDSSQGELSSFDHFMKKVSHGMLGPINNIIQFCEICEFELKNENISKDQLSLYINYIKNESINASDKLNALRQFANLGTGVKQLEDLNNILADVLAELRPIIDSKNAKIIVDRLPLIIGNFYELKLLFKALLENALIFQKPSITPQISVTFKPEAENIMIHINDNGTGINLEYFNKIFDLFCKAYPGGHLGIGLSYSKKIVESLGGTLSCTSTSTEGSTFTICLNSKSVVYPKY